MNERRQIPVYGSEEARTAPVVRCGSDDSHIALRETFREVGGCPYCLHTLDERIAALRAREAAARQTGDDG